METWEIIVWIIVAAAVVLVISVIIAAILWFRRRNRRKKTIKHRRFEWERSDETDFGKRKVYYSKESGQARIVDEMDSGERSTDRTKVEYNARTGKARILGVGDNKRDFEGEEYTQSDSNDEDRIKKFNDYQYSSYVSKESKSRSNEISEVKKSEVKTQDETKNEAVALQSTSVQRERLQPIETLPRDTAMTPQRHVVSRQQGMTSQSNVVPTMMTPQQAINGYTNLGYTEGGQTQYGISNVQFQQPVAIVKAFVNPVQTTKKFGQTRSLSRNDSKLNYKKSFRTSTAPRRRPVLYTWSLTAAGDSEAPWTTLPIAYHEPRAHHRRSTRRRSFTRSKNFRKSSLRKQKDRKHHSLDGIYITDSRPQRSYEDSTKRSSYYGKIAEEYVPETEKSYYKVSKPRETLKNGDFYEEHYKMVKKSQFPASKSSSKWKDEAASRPREFEPEIASIVSGSEFSEFSPVPPRPSESQSDGSANSYSRGSYKAFKSSMEKSSHHSSRSQDKANHTKSFQETLESLRNGDIKDQRSVQREVTRKTQSPWVNNENNFKKEHGVPTSGVQVLPPEPVFIQMVDSDESDYESSKRTDSE